MLYKKKKSGQGKFLHSYQNDMNKHNNKILFWSCEFS